MVERYIGKERRDIRETGLESSNSKIYKFPNLKKYYFSYYDDYLLFVTRKYSKDYRLSILSSQEKLFNKLKDDFSPVSIYDIIKRSKLDEQYSIKGLRNFFLYLEEKELLDKKTLGEYRSIIQYTQPKNFDIYVPSDEKIKQTLTELKKHNLIQYIASKILLETGCRLTELDYFFHHFDSNHMTIQNNVVCYPLNYLRHNKQSYFLFFTKETYELFIENSQEMKNFIMRGTQMYIKRNNLTPLKYFRKYNFTKLISSGIDFNIADFIQGRTSKNVGMNHYLARKEIALKEYNKVLPNLK